MRNQYFRFKQFQIRQDRCAMKVGTDGVLLGAWAGKGIEPEHILDVGTGTGLIALMMAQRFENAQITALEIDNSAARQASENFDSSPFGQRIVSAQADIFSWKTESKYDFVVSNPPFYFDAHPASDAQRSKARHGFDIESFLSIIKNIIAPTGKLAMVLPVHIWESTDPSTSGWQAERLCLTRPTPQKPAHRALIELIPKKSSTPILEQTELIIESGGRHVYSEAYKDLTRAFYVKF